MSSEEKKGAASKINDHRLLKRSRYTNAVLVASGHAYQFVAIFFIFCQKVILMSVTSNSNRHVAVLLKSEKSAIWSM